MNDLAGAALLAAVLVGLALAARWWFVGRPRQLGSAEMRATYATLHTAAAAVPALRTGLNSVSAEKALPHVRQLLGERRVAITDNQGTLAGSTSYDVPVSIPDLIGGVLADGRTRADGTVVVAPLSVEDHVVGTIVVVGDTASAGLTRTTTEVARWMSSQLDLAELEASRRALVEAELRALRAQISPHFIYNSLGAIASFVRTDPERARELLLEFADFTRYSFRQHGEFTTLAEELSSIERYLVLEKARFGDRLKVVMRVAPEVVNVVIPFLSVQPLVENAVRHGLEKKSASGTVTLVAQDVGSEAVVTVEDDGVGADPASVRAALAGASPTGSVGLGNVDERMRTVYGNDHGIVVETAPGAGTKVTVRFPKSVPER